MRRTIGFSAYLIVISTMLFGISIYLCYFFQWIVSGLLGVGVDVLRAVDMESNMDIGVKSDMQEMVVGDVLEVVG